MSDHLCQPKSAFEQLSCEQESRRAWNNGINKLSLTANNKTARFYPNYISEMKSLYLARAKNWHSGRCATAEVNGILVRFQF